MTPFASTLEAFAAEPEGADEDHDSHRAAASEHKRAGTAAAESGAMAKAANHFKLYLQVHSTDAVVWEMLAQVHLELDEAFEAVKVRRNPHETRLLTCSPLLLNALLHLQAASKALEQRPQWATAAWTLGRAQLNFGEALLAAETLRHALYLHLRLPQPAGTPDAEAFAHRQCILAFSHAPPSAACGSACSTSAADSISNEAAYFDPPTTQQAASKPDSALPRPEAGDETGQALYEEAMGAAALVQRWRRSVLPRARSALQSQLERAATSKPAQGSDAPSTRSLPGAAEYPEGLLFKRATVK